MKEKPVTHKYLARLVGVSETTIKSYRRKFADCIPVASQGKPIRFTESALPVCLRIREYFDAGMSVEEVRSRLAQEFVWINPQQPEHNAPSAFVLPQDFTQAVSNLAKSMVTLTQQQGTMLRRVEDIEKTLNSNGAQLTAGKTPSLVLPADALHITLAHLERLNTATETLQSVISELTTAVSALQLQPSRAEIGSAISASEGAKIYRFPTTVQTEHQKISTEEVPSPQDPPRHLLTLPLVVQSAQGSYIGAGGRSRGRFTLNDLKALLVYGREPAEQYIMRWEYTQDSWWLVLEQPQAASQHQLRMQLRELATQRGAAVAEITQLMDSGRSVHPAEICAFVAVLSGAL